MLFLTGTSDKIQVVTSATAAVKCHASWSDNLAGAITPGRTNTASITTATTTDVVASPAASTQRNVRLLNIRNDHASTTCDVTVQHTDGTNTEPLMKATLLAGEELVFDQVGGWTHYDINGGVYGGLPAATQADQESGSSLTSFVTPGRQQFHPSAAKFWCQVTGGGTPALGVSYNVTSVADTAVGRMTVTFTTNFSSANWACVATAVLNTTMTTLVVGNIDSKTASTVEVGGRSQAPAAADPATGYDVAGYGDQ